MIIDSNFSKSALVSNRNSDCCSQSSFNSCVIISYLLQLCVLLKSTLISDNMFGLVDILFTFIVRVGKESYPL